MYGGCGRNYQEVCGLHDDIMGDMRILLDEVMDRMKLTERQVSELTGLPRSLVHDIRRGSRPRIDTVEQLAKGLGIRIRDLMESDYL